MNTLEIHLAAGWTGILLAGVSGLGLGLWFLDPDWLGGYGSPARRLIRLAHIACFGLGIINIAFAFTVARFVPGPTIQLASAGWLLAAASMPVVCCIVAKYPRAHLLFALPVLSFLTAGSATLQQLLRHVPS